ncbi:MAG: gliding motility lipoprotein GldH [Bacteroidales bacterium]|nr:gliding motility lipoprotein GldH [Bacteroidales bacterium]
MRNLYLSSILILSALLAACRSDVVYTETHAVDDHGWNINEPLHYSLDIDDTTAVYNLFVDLRICRNYAYSNSFLFLRTTFPDSRVAIDTLECPLAFADGQWRGKENGRYIDNRYFFKKHVIFPQSGTYTFEITHGMRDTAIAGIKDVGLVMKRAKPGE